MVWVGVAIKRVVAHQLGERSSSSAMALPTCARTGERAEANKLLRNSALTAAQHSSLATKAATYETAACVVFA